MKINNRLLLCMLYTIAALCGGLPASAQQSTRGTLISSAGGPVAGATITIKKTGRTVVADSSGHFTIPATTGDTLLVSSVGFESQEVRVTAGTPLHLTLTSTTGNLNDVIVIGYGTTTRQNITTAVTKVDPKKIPAAANGSVPDLLFGRAAGLQVTQNSSQPGGSIDISIRGKGTPLIVVDGVVYPNSALEPTNGSTELQGVNRGALAGLNPGDIESIELLKDASAAIYGVSASNGVMLITTKKGKAGRMNVSYEGSRSLVSNMTYLQPLNATDYMTYFNQLNKDKYLSDRNMGPFGSTAPDLSGYTPKYTATQIAAAGSGTDWLDQVFRKGSVDNHVLSISGGADKITYYFSGSYFNQVGTVKASDLQRYSGRMNLSFEMNKYLRLNVNVSGNRNRYQNPQQGAQNGNSGSQGFNALQAALAYPASVPVYNTDGTYSQFSIVGNPVSLLTIRDQTQFQGVLANVSLDVTILPKVLTAKLLYGNNNENSNRDFYIPSNVFWGQLYKSRANLSEARRQNQTMEATVSFKKSLRNIVKIDAVAGVGRYLADYAGMNMETSDVMDQINTENLASATGPRFISSYIGQDQLRSFFARAGFDFYDRYLISVSLRRDGSDKFFPNNKYQNFPSVSAAWKVSSESFFENIKAISLLKLRASYGTTGQGPSSAAYGIFAPDPNAITFNNGAVIYFPYRQTATDNPNLQWPVTKTFDAGIDFGILKDRITGSVDWYREDMTRLVAQAATPQLSIVPTAPVNGGHQRRTGIEFSINTANIQTKDFSWNTTFNYTHYSNRWVERFPFDPLPHGGVITDPIGMVYAYHTNGILQQGEKVPTWQPTGATKPGSPLFVDQDGNGRLNDSDIVKYSGIPKAVLGFGNEFHYKQFDLSIFLYGQLGAWGYDYTSLWGDPLSMLAGTQSGTTRIKDAWSTTNTSGTLPGAAYNETSVTGLNAGIDTRLAKKDFLRCRNITLAYNFVPAAISSFAKSLRVYADVQNAFIITGFKGLDPELQASSTKGGPAPYPMIRTFSIGVKANF